MSARSGLVGKTILMAPFGTTSGNFFHGPEKCKKNNIVLGGPMAAIQTVWPSESNYAILLISRGGQYALCQFGSRS